MEDKSIKDKIDALYEKLAVEEKIVPKEKKKFNLNIGFLSWMWGIIFGGLSFLLTWLFGKDLTAGIIAGVFVLVATVFIHSKIIGQFPPLNKKMLSKRKKRLGFCLFINVGENRAITFEKVQIDEGVAIVNGVPHIVEPSDILFWKNKLPVVIQPQWSQKPWNAKQHYDKTVEDKQTTDGWKLIMNYIYKNQITNKIKTNMGLIIFGAIALLGLGYYLIKSGAFK